MARIVRLDRRHIPALAAIDASSGHEGDSQGGVAGKHLERELRERFSQGHEVFFGYKKGGRLVGYVSLKPFFPGHRHCEVYWLAVEGGHQGEGIGSALMRFIESYAREQGFRKVCLYTGRPMRRTRRFYEKLGYRKVNEFPDYYGYPAGDRTAVLYAKSV